MDSLSQLVLGAACGIAVMGRRTAVWKAALWGGLAGTVPDLDVLFDFGDALRNMTYHRSYSHGLAVLTLLAPLLALLPSRLHGQRAQYWSWCLAMWLALVTHPVLDTFTIYGTQLLQPFSDYPYALGSMFMVDPLYTLPLLLGVAWALGKRQFAGLRANALGLLLSSAYLAWSVLAQHWVTQVVRQQWAPNAVQLASTTAQVRFFVTPLPFNTLAWRVVVMQADGYAEGFYSLLDSDQHIAFEHFASSAALEHELKDLWAVRRMAWFSRGFYRLHTVGDMAVLTDLRLGQEPNYAFQFAVAQKTPLGWQAIKPRNLGRIKVANRLPRWLWQRIWGVDVPPPR